MLAYTIVYALIPAGRPSGVYTHSPRSLTFEGRPLLGSTLPASLLANTVAPEQIALLDTICTFPPAALVSLRGFFFFVHSKLACN